MLNSLGGLDTATSGSACWNHEGQIHELIGVETSIAEVGRFEQTVREDGQLRLKHRYTLHAPVSGTLARPDLRVGDSVQRDDVVATLRPSPSALIDPRTQAVFTERIRQSEATIRAAEAQLAQSLVAQEQARSDVEQARELNAQGFTSDSAAARVERLFLQAQQSVATARAQLDAARFVRDEARAALISLPAAHASSGEWLIRSPIEGRVFHLPVDSEGPVTAGQPLMVIGNPAMMEAVIDVLSTEVAGIQPQATVELTWSRQMQPLQGRVQRVEPAAFTKTSALGIEERRVNVVVDVDSPTDVAWGEGFRVDALIQLYAQDNALMIATGAQSTHAWITDGLQAGDTVILYPGSLIQDGQRVHVQARP